MQQYLITTDEVSELARTISAHIGPEKIDVYIRESQDMDLKVALGDALLLDIFEHQENYSELLDGCSYKTKCGMRSFAGLKTSLAYYTYARIVKNGDSNVTRFGFMNKDSEYSSRPDFKEKLMAYNDAFSIAERYLNECVRYLNDNKDRYPLYSGKRGIRANGATYKVHGE